MCVQFDVVVLECNVLVLESVDSCAMLGVLGVELFELLVAAIEFSGYLLELLGQFDIVILHLTILLVLGDIPKIHQILHLCLLTPNN